MPRPSKKTWPISDYATPSLVEARAVHAWAKGEATADQQKIAFNWVIRGACRAGKETFDPEGPNRTAYNSGRLSVSLQIGWVLGQPPESFRTTELD